MGLIAGTSFLAGAILGLRFKVLVLLPAIVVVAAVAGIAAIKGAVDLWSFVCMVIMAVASVQGGYLFGAIAGGVFGVGADQREALSSRSSSSLSRSA